jgi:CRP-like cAMP-binding protein
MQKPSLIPFDVIQDVEREAKQLKLREEALEGREPRTAPQPVPDDVPIFSEVPADREVALLALSQVAMFKDLSRPSLQSLVDGAMQLEIPDGEMLFTEGEDAGSFFVVIDGTLEVIREKEGRQVALRHVGRTDSIGLFGLFSAQLRAASVRSIGDSIVLEISGQKLQSLLERDDLLHTRVLQFFRERLLEALISDIDSIARARLIGRFKNRDLAAGEALLNPGEVSNLIAVVTHGTVILEERSKMGGQPKQFEATTGQFLAVTCAISGLPSKMRVFTPEFATVMLLSHKDLNELMRDYPALRALPARLADTARPLDRDVFCGSTGVPGL